MTFNVKGFRQHWATRFLQSNSSHVFQFFLIFVPTSKKIHQRQSNPWVFIKQNAPMEQLSSAEFHYIRWKESKVFSCLCVQACEQVCFQCNPRLCSEIEAHYFYRFDVEGFWYIFENDSQVVNVMHFGSCWSFISWVFKHPIMHTKGFFAPCWRAIDSLASRNMNPIIS